MRQLKIRVSCLQKFCSIQCVRDPISDDLPMCYTLHFIDTGIQWGLTPDLSRWQPFLDFISCSFMNALKLIFFMFLSCPYAQNCFYLKSDNICYHLKQIMLRNNEKFKFIKYKKLETFYQVFRQY